MLAQQTFMGIRKLIFSIVVELLPLRKGFIRQKRINVSLSI
jgi:hypothetical protein